MPYILNRINSKLSKHNMVVFLCASLHAKHARTPKIRETKQDRLSFGIDLFALSSMENNVQMELSDNSSEGKPI